jgi:methyl-accepting chemotaxis protein
MAKAKSKLIANRSAHSVALANDGVASRHSGATKVKKEAVEADVPAPVAPALSRPVRTVRRPVDGLVEPVGVELEKVTQNGHKKLQWLLIGAGSAMLLALVFFMIMGVRMVSRINQLDAMVIEVGKKVIELNTGLASLDTVNTTLTEMAQRQEALRQASTEIEGRIEASLKQSEAMVQQVPAQTAQQVAATSENLVKQVQGINSRLQTQASAVQTLSRDVQSLKGSVGNVDKLNRDVQALVTLQRERYLEALQKNQAAAAAAAAAREAAPAPAPARDRAVQYPRVPPPAPAPAEGAARSP